MSTTTQQTNNTINTTTNQTTLNYDIEQFRNEFETFLQNSKYCTTLQFIDKKSRIYITWTGSRNKDFKKFANDFKIWYDHTDVEFYKEKFGLDMIIDILR